MAKTFGGLAIAFMAASTLATAARAQDPVPPAETLEGAFPAQRHFSPYAGRNFPTQVYWGDTHLHTALSMDAGAFGNRLGLDEAYRFARGEEVASATGQLVKLSRPLDFLVVADHSDNMGFFPDLFAGAPEILADPTGKRWYEMIQAGGGQAVGAALEIIDMASRGTFPQSLYYAPGTASYRSAWESTIKAAEEYNDPGRFTAFIGYEWTSLVPPGNNLHRVIVYRDGGDKAIQTEPFTMLPPLGSVHPEDLWVALQAYEDKTGGRLLAIPHNGNLSNGLMFPLINPVTDRRLTPEYAETRIRWEPLYEVTQIKGDGEAHPFLSPDDEFADYENWDVGNLNLSELKAPEMLQYEYARTALQLGLQVEQRLGINPYKFGMIGSTDSHTSLATAAEENFFGKHSGTEPDVMRWEHPVLAMGDVKIMGWEQVSSGYAAVWATENTREAIWDAMKRREVYATTGPRMVVRFFGGWEFTAADAMNRLPAAVGYTKGVPMGADLPPGPAGQAPTFLVGALKDPLSGNLDRIQIVKGWVDARGERHEKVHDIAWSDGRTPGADGKLPPVGNTVDVANATWTNTIGDPELITVWTDPDFDPNLRAVYYARVIEIPTPRWTAYDAKRFGIEISDEVPMWTQERAYTSPIWFTPGQ
jgi:hypothetical protein